MSELSAKQRQILEYMKAEVREKGYPPSVREICDAVGLKSTSTVHGHLSRLEKKGLIRRDPTKPRAIEILDSDFDAPQREFVNVPIVGNITAGTPILAVENIEDTFPIPVDYIHNDTVFMLRVKGESGQIVVAIVGDEATVKTFYKEKDFIRLQPENPSMSPIIVKDVAILGKVIGLFRKF